MPRVITKTIETTMSPEEVQARLEGVTQSMFKPLGHDKSKPLRGLVRAHGATDLRVNRKGHAWAPMEVEVEKTETGSRIEVQAGLTGFGLNYMRGFFLVGATLAFSMLLFGLVFGAPPLWMLGILLWPLLAAALMGRRVAKNDEQVDKAFAAFEHAWDGGAFKPTANQGVAPKTGAARPVAQSS